MSSVHDIETTAPPKVEDFLNEVNYSDLAGYVPSAFALDFVNFIKLVNGGESENKTPPVHYRMVDNFIHDNGLDTINMCHRGIAKSTLKEFLILYIAVYGELPGFGKVPYALYVSDSMDNGVKKMRKALEFRINNSAFLQKYIKETKFTDIRWEFINITGNSFVVSGHGAKTGVRGPLSLDSLVYTDNGTKTIDKVQINDLIYTPEGKLTKVTGKSEIFHGEMYKLTFDDGRTLKCDSTHLHPLYVRKDTKKDGIRKIEYIKKLFTTQELVDGKPLVKGTFRRYFTKAVKPVEYTNKDLPLDPYILGILLGDGNLPVGKSPRLSGLEDDVNSYINTMESTPLTEVNYAERSGVPMKRITFLGLREITKNLNLQGKIDYQKSIPHIYQRGSIEQRRRLLAGLLDTDGTCGNEGQVSYSTVSKELCEDITELARSLGYLVRCSASKRDNKRDLYRVFIRGDVNPFLLPRKRKLFRVPDKRSNRVALVNIERIPDEPSQCIRVEDEIHEFITDNYLATHNTRENGSRPVLALLDDLISDEDARSPTVIANVESTIYNAIEHALNPNKRKIIWSGTPFNAKDPLYKAVESGAWNVNVYPVCEKFPCSREEFSGSWPDRFNYDYVLKVYEKAKRSGKIASFNQELMLSIMSDDERLILDSDIQWYSRKTLMQQREYFNFYITTDFATSDKQSADFSVISVWAVNASGHFFWVDGICKKQTMDKNIIDLFRLVQMYNPLSVGVEVTGQQGGFIPYINEQMMKHNTFFSMASENNSNKPGIRPTTNKHQRFNIVLPYFKQYMVHFPIELQEEPIMLEAMNELSLICADSFKSKHDDFIDTVSMLGSMMIAKPSVEGRNSLVTSDDRFWEDDDDEDTSGGISNYIA